MTEYWDDIAAEKKKQTHIKNSKTVKRNHKRSQATSLLKNIFNEVITNSTDMNEAKFTNIEIFRSYIELRWGEKESLCSEERSMLSKYRQKRESGFWIFSSCLALLVGFSSPPSTLLFLFPLIITIPLVIKNFDPGLPDYIDENNYNFIRIAISNELIDESIPIDSFNSDPSIIIPIIAKKLLNPEMEKKRFRKGQDYWYDSSDGGS